MERYKLGKIKIEMPTGWHEVPYSTGLEILADQEISEVKILSLLSGQTEETLRKATDYKTLLHFANAFEFVKRMPRNLMHPEMPKSIKFKGDRLIMPFVVYGDMMDLGKASTGQIEDMIATLRKMAKDFIGEVPEDEEPRAITEYEELQMIPYIVAIYLQKIRDKEYDYDEAMRMVDDVRACSFKDVVNMGYFFLLRLIALKTGSQKTVKKYSSIKRRFKRVYGILTQHLVSKLP